MSHQIETIPETTHLSITKFRAVNLKTVSKNISEFHMNICHSHWAYPCLKNLHSCVLGLEIQFKPRIETSRTTPSTLVFVSLLYDSVDVRKLIKSTNLHIIDYLKACSHSSLLIGVSVFPIIVMHGFIQMIEIHSTLRAIFISQE